MISYALHNSFKRAGVLHTVSFAAEHNACPLGPQPASTMPIFSLASVGPGPSRPAAPAGLQLGAL